MDAERDKADTTGYISWQTVALFIKVVKDNSTPVGTNPVNYHQRVWFLSRCNCQSYTHSPPLI